MVRFWSLGPVYVLQPLFMDRGFSACCGLKSGFWCWEQNKRPNHAEATDVRRRQQGGTRCRSICRRAAHIKASLRFTSPASAPERRAQLRHLQPAAVGDRLRFWTRAGG